MSVNQDFEVVLGGLISSASSDYEVQDILGCGNFGEVAQCRKLATNEMVAVKILKTKSLIEEAKEEEEMLKKLKELSADKFNIVRWTDSFTYKGRFCLEFEKLDISLRKYLQKSPSQCLDLTEIRPIVQQLATALNFLKNSGIVHADLKSENIMMVDHLQQPLRVKVIDFGLAVDNPKSWRGATFQSLWYRSPEILLGCSFNEAIDVWSLGCIAAEMLMGNVLFPASDAFDLMRHISNTIGKPPDHLLAAGLYSKKYYRLKHAGQEPPKWKMKSIVKQTSKTCKTCTIKSLSDLKKGPHTLSGEEACADECDRDSFVDLLTKMLKVDAADRITPSQILQHPFLTISHLVGKFDESFYVRTSVELMSNSDHLSCGDGEDVAPAYSTYWIGETPRSPSMKRKKDSADDLGCDNSSPNIPPKKRRRESLGAPLIETGGQMSPHESPQRKRKRDDAETCITLDSSSPAQRRKRETSIKSLLTVTKLLSNTGACSSSTPVTNHKKRKRADEEASDSTLERPSPIKKRRQSLDGSEG